MGQIVDRSLRVLGVRRWLLAALFGGILLPLFAFGWLAEDVWQREGFGWDVAILRFVHARATPNGDALMLFITRVGAPLPMIGFVGLALLALLARGRRGDAAFFALAVGGAATLNVMAKLLFQRARPNLWTTLVAETDYSFPSGHAMGSLAVIAALALVLWATPWRWPVIALGGIFVLAVGLSRIYPGVHYPSDILAGWSASLAWVVGARLAWEAPLLQARLRPWLDRPRGAAASRHTVSR